MRNVGLFAVAVVVVISVGFAVFGSSNLPGLAPIPTPKAQYGLVKEGGFDKGLADWENAGGAPPVWDYVEGHAGKGSAKINHTVLQQRFATRSETPVILTFWAKAASPIKMNIYTMCSAEFWQETIDVGKDWQEYSFDITKTSLNQDEECAVFENETNVDAWVDDVVVKQGKQ